MEKKKVVLEHQATNGNSYQSIELELMNLRSLPKNCDNHDVIVMIRKYNFLANNINATGTFDNILKLQTINNDKIIISKSTGLMWHQSGSEAPINWYKGKGWIRELNRSGYAGFFDWRIPTVEEVASLLKEREINMDLFVDNSFSNLQNSIWTCDNYGTYYVWRVDFQNGCINLKNNDCKSHIRHVRSCK